ncbi:pimeloyl-ACP methyl ester carboxylesterase [Rhodococcus fascians]|uniref:alpha/beta fold hydrolase n=1 Tax=Nocardiaceae TaxID=85025 RepID=UPI0028589865|nr:MULTISPECIES: alpha/beta fold hydrolase [Rhodococcus]MDR6910729.1 pimeloyl-ACP methyl ester carboxylesterase [Rhodococcus sp. 3258]MDR6931904.1 pimeloyl-ACP methyl ester carboxylesterase [Rhodococcus fascians]
MTSELDHDSTLRDVDTELGVLRYHEAGDGPPLLLLHGSGPGVTGWRNYRGVLDDLASRFRCYILEFPGFGVSDAGPSHPMVMAQQSVGLFLDALGVGPVDVVGNSMGGIVGINVAINEPHRVRRLVTIGGVGRPVLSSGPSEGIKLLMEFTDEPSRENLVRWLRSMVFDQSLVTDELIEERLALATEPATLEIARRMYSSAAFGAAMKAAASSPEPPYWSQLGRIEAPTLLTWGRDDRVSPVDMALVPMRDIPNGELHVFPNCGHWAMIEARAAWLGAVIEFLER